MPNLTDALRKATSIGPDPFARSNLTLGEMPLTPDVLESLGKPISELLGMMLRTPMKTGLPSRLRLTNWNAGTGKAALTGLRKGAEGFEATPTELDALLNAGTVDVQQPPQSAVDAIRRKLAALLGPQ